LAPFFFSPSSPPSAEKEFVLSLVISSPKWKEGTIERGGENDEREQIFDESLPSKFRSWTKNAAFSQNSNLSFTQQNIIA
jgi:hypothetical protein